MPLQRDTGGYDEELLFLIGDWYHWPGDRVLANFMDRTSTGSEVSLEAYIDFRKLITDSTL